MKNVKTYLIVTSDRMYVKVGKSYDIRSRIAAIQTGCPLPVVLMCYFDENIEEQLHALFSQHKTSGEWFDFKKIQPLLAPFSEKMKYGMPDVVKEDTTDTIDSFVFYSYNPYLKSDEFKVIVSENEMTMTMRSRKSPSPGLSGYYLGWIKDHFPVNDTHLYILDCMLCYVTDEETVVVTVEQLISDTRFPKGTIHKTIVRLLSCGLIAKWNRKNCYFINPSILFKGDRVAIIMEYVNESEKLVEATTKEIRNIGFNG